MYSGLIQSFEREADECRRRAFDAHHAGEQQTADEQLALAVHFDAMSGLLLLLTAQGRRNGRNAMRAGDRGGSEGGAVMAGHTEGKWRACLDALTVVAGQGDQTQVIADVSPDDYGHVMDQGQVEANLFVLAAAPRMLAALEGLTIEDCDTCGGDGREPGTDDDACGICGGSGERIFGGDPGQVRDALNFALGVNR